MKISSLLVSGLTALTGVQGAEPASDKSQYHLFNPTPKALMREMSTDRPDRTESAYTVDAGHYQIEMDVLNYAYDRHNSDRARTRVESVGIAPMNLKVGLANYADLQVLFEPYTSVRTHDRSARSVEKNRGFGDTTVRAKVNLWGNDGGDTAFALMPFVKLPTNQDDLGNNSVEGGLIAPLAVALPGGWGMGVMTEVDFVRDDFDRDHDLEWVNTITFAHDIVGNLAGFIEFFSAISSESEDEWVGTFDVGLTYALTEDIQLDGGVYIGVTRPADDITTFLGLSWRF